MSTFTDNLDGTSGTNLSARTGWSRPTGADNAILRSGSGYALSNGTTNASGTWHKPTSQPGGNDQYAEALVTGSAVNAFQLGVRCDTSSATGQGYLCRRNSTTTLQLFVRNSSGTLTQLGTTYTDTQANLDASKVRLEVTGTSIQVKLGSTVVIGPVTDATIASGSVAMLSRGGTNPATTNVDDWGSGDLTAVVAVGLTTATNTALALSAVDIRAAGLSTATNTALALGSVGIRATGLNTEADASISLAALLKSTTAISSETDAALALTTGVTIAVGLASTTDTALALSPGEIAAAGTASESEAAIALGIALAFAPASETDAAFNLTSPGVIGAAAETDAALALAALTIGAVTAANDNETPFALGGVTILALSLASETDEALGLSQGPSVVLPVPSSRRIAETLGSRRIAPNLQSRRAVG
jgi:hypothetical protein